MVGYGEVLQTIGAMVIFSLILLSATSMIQRNTYMQVEGELEQEVIAVAQDVIEEARTKEFDEFSKGAAPPADIPGDFTSPYGLGPGSATERSQFDDFDDYHDWEDVINTEHGAFDIRVEVFYVDENFQKVSYRTTFKKMKVYISSKYLDGDIDNPTYSLEFVRNYYAD
jgi:type II secretory pathway pseudopilin PulG